MANDISASRCKALLKNLEVFGVPNALVANGIPARLQERFPEYFDRILLDAPCSGEGMFRKDADTIRAWYPDKPAECAALQRELILRAADMLRPGGRMLYSTCTFAPEENEEVIRFLLEQRPEMALLKIPRGPGRENFGPGLEGMEDCVRLWPHRLEGEGHFLALLEKQGQNAGLQEKGFPAQTGGKAPNREEKALLDDFFDALLTEAGKEKSTGRPAGRTCRTGILGAGADACGSRHSVSAQRPVSGRTEKMDGLSPASLWLWRFRPMPALPGAICPRRMRGFSGICGERPSKWAKKEASLSSGWLLVCAGGYPLGWGKAGEGKLRINIIQDGG